MSFLFALRVVHLDVEPCISKSKIEKMAAVTAVRFGLLTEAISDVQDAYDPPVFNVCFHKDSGSCSSSGGYTTMDIEFVDGAG